MNNRNSIIFAGAVLAAVLLGNITRESSPEVTLETKTENTSLVANIKTVSYADTPFLPSELTAQSALVRDLSAQKPVWTLNPEQMWPTASLAKLVTAVVAKEKIDLGQRIKVSAEAVATEGEAGALKTDGVYSLEDLLKALLIVSSNDAATALMEFYGETKFIDEASENLVSLFNNGGRTLLIIVLGSEDRAKYTQILYDYFTSH